MRPQSLPLESLARGQSAVSYDLSCPRTFRIAKSTQERKKSCDEAIDGGLQSHSLEPGHGSATCQVGDFTQITEDQRRNKIETKKTVTKINEAKSWFYEKMNKIDKPLARLIKKKGERIQISKIRNKKGKVTTDFTERPRIIRD